MTQVQLMHLEKAPDTVALGGNFGSDAMPVAGLASQSDRGTRGREGDLLRGSGLRD